MCLEWNRSVPPRSSLFSFWRQGPIWSIGKTLIGGQNLGLLQYPVLDGSWTSFHPVLLLLMPLLILMYLSGNSAC